MPIYTKTGDKGKTSLFNGQRVIKSHIRVETYGTVDELNSAIGVAIAEIQNYKSKVKSELVRIQNDLFAIGSQLANPDSHSGKRGTSASRIRFWTGQNDKAASCHFNSTGRQNQNDDVFKKRVIEFEKQIDEMTAKMPPLSNFILPGGSKVGSQLHLARTVCRKAERRIVELSQKETVQNGIIIYLNRLSDLLFTMARFVNFAQKKKETLWTK